MNARRLLFMALLSLAAGCARADRAPLPGDSVSLDGGIALTPGRVPVSPAPAQAPTPQEAYPPALGAVSTRFAPASRADHASREMTIRFSGIHCPRFWKP